MEVMIKNGKIEIPREILKKARISEEGKCEMDIVDDEIRIKNKKQKAGRILELLNKPPAEQNIEDMVKASESHDD